MRCETPGSARRNCEWRSGLPARRHNSIGFHLPPISSSAWSARHGGGRALLASGLAMVAIAVITSAPPWLPSAKLPAKLIVVGALTPNGWALHAWVFPRLRGAAVHIDHRLWPAAALGAISSASSLYASFVGVARVVSPWLSLAAFMALYSRWSVRVWPRYSVACAGAGRRPGVVPGATDSSPARTPRSETCHGVDPRRKRWRAGRPTRGRRQ